jgi:predicted ATPase
MSRTKVACLDIKQFRRFQNITIPFGEHVTLIVGQNGTSKSTLLGMLAQPFSFGVVRGKTAKSPDASIYTNNYHGLKLHEYEDLTGRPFMYDCDDVFRLSKAFDFGKEYEYKIRINSQGHTGTDLSENPLLTKSRPRKTNTEVTGMRFVTGPGASHESGEGNYPHPVLFLGLNRLWPLAVTKKCSFPGDVLSSQDSAWYVEKYNEVLCLDEHGNRAKFMDTSEKKKFITPESGNYDGESCSAGQDNLSQILTAILSFRALKNKLGERYQGGMLLIDELDATLHAFAQSKLLALLCEASKKLDLQIVATTHSLRLLEDAYQSRLNRDIELLHLANRDGVIAMEEFQTYQEVADHLRVEVTSPRKKPDKVSVVFEDDEGRFLFQQICGSKLRNYIACANTSSLGAGQLKNLAEMSKKLPVLESAIFIPDGDMAKQWPKPPRNLLALPGRERPETLVYKHLFSMRDSDPFWKECGSTYTKQFALTSKGGTSLNKGDDKRWVKNWYNEQRRYWGRGKQKPFKSWVQAHRIECLDFCKQFIRLLRSRYRVDIPQNAIDKILEQFEVPSQG